MTKFKDLTGLRFGRLLVKEYCGVRIDTFKSGTYSNRVWLCECDCGNEKIIKQSPLTSGRQISCGCRLKEVRNRINVQKYCLPQGTAAWNLYYGKYKDNAKKHRRVFELTLDEFRQLCLQSCVYCGIEPSRVEPSGRKKSSVNGTITVNGIDRIDNDCGYTTLNSVPCCTQCNLAKGKFSKSDWDKWLERIIDFRK